MQRASPEATFANTSTLVGRDRSNVPGGELHGPISPPITPGRIEFRHPLHRAGERENEYRHPLHQLSPPVTPGRLRSRKIMDFGRFGRLGCPNQVKRSRFRPRNKGRDTERYKPRTNFATRYPPRSRAVTNLEAPFPAWRATLQRRKQRSRFRRLSREYSVLWRAAPGPS